MAPANRHFGPTPSSAIRNLQNLRRVEESLNGGEIDALNKMLPGLGSKMQRILSTLGKAHSAQSGHFGPVGIAKQTQSDNRGVTQPALVLGGGAATGKVGATAPYSNVGADRIAGLADPLDDLDAVNLRTTRRLIDAGITNAQATATTTIGKTGPGGGTGGSGPPGGGGKGGGGGGRSAGCGGSQFALLNALVPSTGDQTFGGSQLVTPDVQVVGPYLVLITSVAETGGS